MALLSLTLATTVALAATGDEDRWSKAEFEVLASLHIGKLGPARPDPSNAYQSLPRAAALGKRLFFDPRLSANGKISCASCHIPGQQFQDGKPVAIGVGTGLRRTMPVADTSHLAWLFWDGRKDSLWSQALGPLEDANEHGGNRVAFARLMRQFYQSEYEAVFRGMPALDGLPENASPNGNAAEQLAWKRLSDAQRMDVSRVFANIGKAIAAYEGTLQHGPSRLDHYIAATLARVPDAASLLTAPEKRGLRLFMGKADCISCHGGPLLTDQGFHNTGVGARGLRPDPGRGAAVAQLLRDQFNCLGPFSDASPADCQELQFVDPLDPLMAGAFKVPSLRNVAGRAPYMHAGQIGTLEGVIRHYAAAPRSAVGRNERRPISLSSEEIGDLVRFLGTLTGPVEERLIQPARQPSSK